MEKLNAIAKQLSAVWKRISLNQRISIVLVAVVMVLGLWLFARLSYRPSMALLYPHSLDPGDAAAITEKLRDENIKFQIRDGGRRICVPTQRVNELRLTMAATGLPANTGGTGWGDLFDKSSLGGQSEMMININKLRALQGELSRTISSLSGVRSARVHVVLEKETLFKQDTKPAKASVVLELSPGHELGASEIDGIRFLCASAIEGLKTNNITILDNTGRILARMRDEDTLFDMSADQIALARDVEKNLAGKIAAQLDTAVGPGNSTVTVSVELNNESLYTRVEKVSPGVTHEKTTDSRSDSTKDSRGGEPGAVTNIIGGTDEGGSAGRSTDVVTTIEIEPIPSKTYSETRVPAGAIKQVTASVILNKDRKDQTFTVAKCEQLVKTIIKFDETRNDQVSVHEASFYEPPVAEAPVAKPPSPIITAISKHGPAAIVSIALLGFLWIVMKKTRYAEGGARFGASRGAAAMTASADAGVAAGRMAGATPKSVQEILDSIVLEGDDADLRGLRDAVSQLADQKPEGVASVIREWVS